MNSDIADMSMDKVYEWVTDIGLFDELEDIGDAEDFLQALDSAPYANSTLFQVGSTPHLDFDIDLPPWTSDTCWGADTDGELTERPVSPGPAVSSTASSPGLVEALSPLSLHGETEPPRSLPSPASACSSRPAPPCPLLQARSPRPAPPCPLLHARSPRPAPERRTHSRSSPSSRAKPAVPLRRPSRPAHRVSIQPKPTITLPFTQCISAPPKPKAIVLQPTHTVLSVITSPPLGTHPVSPAGRPVINLHGPQILPAPPLLLALPSRVVTVPTTFLDRHVTTATSALPVATRPIVAVAFPGTAPDSEPCVERRHQRAVKNRESAMASRLKRKQQLLALEDRLQGALCENQKLRCENGSLRTQVDGLLSENTVLKVMAPKRRAVCLMVVLVFVMLNVGPMSVLEGEPSSGQPVRAIPSSRHLLGFSPDGQNGTVQEAPEAVLPPSGHSWEEEEEEKALIVVKKEPLWFGHAPPCQPTVSRVQSIRLSNELRGWVHRHEADRMKSKQTTTAQHGTKTIPHSEKKATVTQVVTVQYTDTAKSNPGSEVQVYYRRHHSHSDFFDELNRRGDTFYVVSFHRDHLLLPATNHNKGSRPKMTLVLPAMNIQETIVKDEAYKVMMQIDCEVTNTRILHIKSSSIPEFLRANGTEYRSTPAGSQGVPSGNVLSGSA